MKKHRGKSFSDFINDYKHEDNTTHCIQGASNVSISTYLKSCFIFKRIDEFKKWAEQYKDDYYIFEKENQRTCSIIDGEISKVRNYFISPFPTMFEFSDVLLNEMKIYVGDGELFSENKSKFLSVKNAKLIVAFLNNFIVN